MTDAEYLDLLREVDEADCNVTSWEAEFIESVLYERHNEWGLTDAQKLVIDQMADKYL